MTEPPQYRISRGEESVTDRHVDRHRKVSLIAHLMRPVSCSTHKSSFLVDLKIICIYDLHMHIK